MNDITVGEAADKWDISQWKRLFVVVALIIAVCLSLWYLRNFHRVSGMLRAVPENGTYDLTGIDFSTGFVRLEGDLEYISGILTPEEFELRESEAAIGSYWELPSATTRLSILLPDNGMYLLTCSSVDYSHRVYINGMLRYQAGVPAEKEEDFEPGCSQMLLEVMPDNGLLEIVQQSANFVHRAGGSHGGIYIGKTAAIYRFLALTFGTEFITVGLFTALFLVHLVLFIVRQSYRANFYFSMLCLMWAVRSGLTGAKVIYTLFPALPWQAVFRTEYLSLPIASVLLVLLAREIFPGIPQKWFVRFAGMVSICFILINLAADTVFMSWALLGFEGFFSFSICYLCVRFAIKVPGMMRRKQFRIEQHVSLIGYSFFLYAAIHDALYHLNVPYYLGLKIGFTLTGPAMLIFSFLQMTAMSMVP